MITFKSNDDLQKLSTPNPVVEELVERLINIYGHDYDPEGSGYVALVEPEDAASDKEARQLANAIKKQLANQTKILKVCPYCGEDLQLESAHADHIYPVSKGGHSTNKNMVYVCASCNMKKKNHTLCQFIKKTGYERGAIEDRLDLLKNGLLNKFEVQCTFIQAIIAPIFKQFVGFCFKICPIIAPLGTQRRVHCAKISVLSDFTILLMPCYSPP